MSNDDIFDDSKWSDPVYFEMLGIDQDVSLYSSHVLIILTSSCSSMMMIESTSAQHDQITAIVNQKALISPRTAVKLTWLLVDHFPNQSCFAHLTL